MIKTINPLADNRWDDFVIRHPKSTIFHHSVWFKVLHDRYQRDVLCYVLETGNGEIYAGIPLIDIPSNITGKRLDCLPCSEYCYPLVYSSKDLIQLLEAVKEKIDIKPEYFFEIKGWEELISPEESGFAESSQYLQHISVLKDNPAGRRAEFDKNYHLKRNLEKAERSKITIRDADGDDDLKRFSQLSVITRRRLNLLPWPSQFIKSIHRHVIAAGYGFLLLAEFDGRVVAGSLYLCFKDRAILKINASDKLHAKLRANYLITIKAMERAFHGGYKHFDFGITHLNNSGLIAFKRQWGSNESQINYYTYFGDKSRMNPREKPSYRKVYNLINKIAPTFMVKIASNILYRHLG
jgi:hypothetical protein